mgnify:CR=1 FL=1
MQEVRALVDAQLTETGIEHRISRGHMVHTSLIGSPLQLRQIMVNLFSNAIKYNKEGGSIETYAGELSCDGKIVYYEFIITDTGVGMSREFVEEHLFKPFTQEQSDARTQYKGTGLGMSIVQGLIQKMHGSVQVESELGKGTKITCQIPFELDTESEMIKETGEISDVTAIENLHILLAEDNEINMEIAEFYLEDMKIKVDKAWNGKEAVEMFAASEPGTYDMILMDIMMPVMDGLEAARYIRQMERSDAKKIPILALTAQVTSESIVECGKAGMDGHLTKPIEAQKLKEQGREKRLEMAKPDSIEKEVAEAPGVYCYTPEIGGQKPDCQMEASRGYYGKHWFIDTPLELKGRGIELIKKYQEKDFCNSGDYRVGWNEYRVTNKAFEKLKSQYSISNECYLD